MSAKEEAIRVYGLRPVPAELVSADTKDDEATWLKYLDFRKQQKKKRGDDYDVYDEGGSTREIEARGQKEMKMLALQISKEGCEAAAEWPKHTVMRVNDASWVDPDELRSKQQGLD
jgi:hypothetical protein